MSSTTRPASRIRRRALAAALATGAAASAVVASGPAALASPSTPSGYSQVQRCTQAAGSTTFSPGLIQGTRNQTGQLVATLDGCVNAQTGAAEPGQGSLSANLSGASSVSSVAQRGTFVVNWPASSGLNPSTGRLGITGPSSGVYTVSGSITGGAYAGAVIRTSYVVTGVNPGGTGTSRHPITLQSFTNTAPLQVLRNFG